MDGNGDRKVVINLATGMEDPERVMVAFLVAGAAATAGRDVTMFLTKEAVRLALPGVAEGVACEGCPPLPTLATQYANTRILVESRSIEEAMPRILRTVGESLDWVLGARWRSLSRLPVLLQHTQARRGRPRRACGDWWRDPPLGMDR